MAGKIKTVKINNGAAGVADARGRHTEHRSDYNLSVTFGYAVVVFGSGGSTCMVTDIAMEVPASTVSSLDSGSDSADGQLVGAADGLPGSTAGDMDGLNKIPKTA